MQEIDNDSETKTKLRELLLSASEPLTKGAMRQAILDLPDVTSCFIEIPLVPLAREHMHKLGTIAFFVDGGDDQQIAGRILDLIPVHSQTVGSTTVSVTRPIGTFEVAFSRPDKPFCWNL